MKILHVNKFFDFHGGAERSLHEILHAQEKAGDEVHVFSTRSPGNVPSSDGKYFVERLNFDQREGWWKDLRKATKFIWNTEAQTTFARMLDEVKPDIVHLHNIYHHFSSSILAPIRARKLPCVMTLRDYKLANPNYSMFCHGAICEHAKGGRYWETVKHRCVQNRFSSSLLAAFEMWMTKRTHAYERTVQFFLCPSRFIQKLMEQWGEPKQKLRYLPNSVRLPDVPASRGGGYVLYAGRLSVEKGLPSFIRASACVPELPVKIAGSGPEESSLHALIEELGATHIELIGFRDADELAQIRSFAEAVVLPTVSYENASVALLEAMADGLPCLATRIGGNPELVEDGVNGFLVEPGDVDDWEHALRRFVALPKEARDQFGLAGRKKIIQNHLWSTHIERLREVYQDAMRLARKHYGMG